MKLSKLYSSDSRFEAIIFNTNNINAILATGTKPHSVGKTTLFKLVDYCLIKKSKPTFLEASVFEDFTFYLELELAYNSYITIRRKVKKRTKIAIKLHSSKEDFTLLEDSEFDIIDGYDNVLAFFTEKINFLINDNNIAKYRNYLSYFLREKDDFSHPFMLNKYKKGTDVEWKTIVASMVGLDATIVRSKYNIEKEIENLESEIASLENNSHFSLSDIEVVKETLLVLQNELNEKETLYKNFDFYLKEHHINKELVDEVEEIIANLNKERYSLDKKQKLIEKSLVKEQEIDLKKVKKLFSEVHIHLSEMLVKSYEDVIEFNNKITKDRELYLQAEHQRILKRLSDIDDILLKENNKRKELLSVLTDTDTFRKFKNIEQEIVTIKTNINLIEEKYKKLREYKCKLKRVKILKKRKNKLVTKLDHSIKIPNDTLKTIKATFKKLSRTVLGVDAMLNIALNSNDNLVFETKVIDTTVVLDNSIEEGEAYSRMFCFIFDASIALAYKNQNFFHFIAHDGLFDNLGVEYKKGIVDVLNLLVQNGLQYIFTSIEDEIDNEAFLSLCKSEYLVKELADTNTQRLFRMDTF
ncbi:MAG: hypothetical protein NTW78_12470 [Campylobacterales bacterium]|nr:hypothetical protein [Campylobacterales bacterium]